MASKERLANTLSTKRFAKKGRNSEKGKEEDQKGVTIIRGIFMEVKKEKGRLRKITQQRESREVQKEKNAKKKTKRHY